jgi:twitching motility protein PilT
MNMELSTLLTDLIEAGGSDLHLVVGEPPVFRVNGDLSRRNDPALEEAQMEALLLPHLTPAQREMLMEQHQDVERTYRQGGRTFRIHVFRERGHLGAAIRPIPQDPPTLEQLELPKVLHSLLTLPRGLILVTGPTGSGKTTTAVAMLETINRTSARRIVTIEDPIEYEFHSKQSLITQRSVGEDVESMRRGAYWAFRDDPDIVLIAEMRDLETIQLALALAESGHLVFSTLHLGTTSEALKRLIDVFPEPRDLIRRMLARNVAAIIAQQLMPRIDRKGRVAANEILIATPEVRKRIAEGETDLRETLTAGREQGMQTMDDALLNLYRQGIISHDTAWARLEDRERLSSIAEPTSKKPGEP